MMDMARAKKFWEGVGEKGNIIWLDGIGFANPKLMEALVLQT
jgi:hypothetical protein